MKIWFVNSAHVSLWGGGEKWTIAAANWFATRGHEVIVVGRKKSRLLQSATAHHLVTASLKFAGVADPASYLQAYQLLRHHRPDLVVANFNVEGFHIGIPARILGIPLVARHGFPILRNAVHHRFLINKLYSKLIVNAESIRDRYQALGYKTDEIEIIHNGVSEVKPDRETWRKQWDIKPDECLIVGAGRLEQQKRFDRFLQIAQHIISALPHTKFAIVGDGPFQSQLEAQADNLGLKGRIIFPGFDEQFATRIAAADLFLLTSEEEGTPNVVLEAMSAGVPVLAQNAGSLPSILSGDLSANLFAQDDITAMTARAIELLKSHEHRQNISVSSREQIQANFSFAESMQRFEKLFKSVVGSALA